jgi:photosystem II stability/assembly factor-like uncharacterized protein
MNLKNLLLFCIFFQLIVLNVQAQWKMDATPFSQGIISVGAKDSNVYVGLINTTYFFNKNGQKWTEINDLSYLNVRAFEFLGNVIYAGTDAGLYKSDNKGASWSHIAVPGSTVRCVAARGSQVVIGNGSSGDKCYISDNYGIDWRSIDSTSFRGMAAIIKDSIIIVGGSGTLRVSTNAGKTWKTIKNIYMEYLRTLFYFNNKLFAGTEQGVYISSDNGLNWTPLNKGLNYKNVGHFAISGKNLLAGAYGALYSLNSADSTWSVYQNLTDNSLQINGLAVDNGKMYVGSTYGSLYTLDILTSENSVKQPIQDLSIHPNPFDGVLYIDLKEISDSSEIIIINLQGQEVFHTKSNFSKSMTLNLENLSNGVYWLKIQNANTIQTKKIILN